MTAGTIVLALQRAAAGQAGQGAAADAREPARHPLGEITRLERPSAWPSSTPTWTATTRRITWVRRSDGSGTTAPSPTTSPARQTRAVEEGDRTGKSVAWPVGIGAKGNDGVAAIIEPDARRDGLRRVRLRRPEQAADRRATRTSTASSSSPSASSIRTTRSSRTAHDGGQTPDQIALASAKLPANFLLSIPDPAAQNAYPIVTYTWLLVPKEYRRREDGRQPLRG